MNDNIDGDLDSGLSQHDEPNEPSEKIDLYSTLSNDEATDADNDNQNLEALEKQMKILIMKKIKVESLL